MRFTRRRFLQVGGALAALPWLDASGTAHAAASPIRRVVFFHTPQGTVLSDYVPTRGLSGGATDFALSPILEPLAAFRDRMIVLTGIDNRQTQFNTVGNAHQNGNFTLYTGAPFLVQDPARVTAGAPSVDQVIADRLGAGAAFPRLDFSIGGTGSAGIFRPTEGSYFWHGAADPVSFFYDPTVALLRIFGDASRSPAEVWAERARRSSVLDGVLRGFDRMSAELSGSDRERLQAHAAKVAALERRITAGVGACEPPRLDAYPPFDPAQDDDLSSYAINDLIATALSCDHTRVATVHFANAHDHDFPWLWAENGGPIVDRTRFDTWHSVVHADPQPGMWRVYRWYHEVLADLVDRLATTLDPDGLPLLDSTLVVCTSEFSSGRHWVGGLPALLLGATGAAAPGRWIDYFDGGYEAFAARGGYRANTANTNQLWTSVLQLLGGDDAFFGHRHDSVEEGPLPGLV
jgi:hypothetical protein